QENLHLNSHILPFFYNVYSRKQMDLHSKISDSELLRLLINGDSSAYTLLYNRNKYLLFTFAA
ncbi:MAG: hypothetical protein ABWZ79_03450, partial [Pedobacter agri]